MKNDFERLDAKLIRKTRLFELKQVTTQRSNGHQFVHDIIFHPGAAVIIPMLSRDEFVLIKQFRTAAEDILWEFPAGTLEKGESPLFCAKREIIEETGFEAKHWKKLGKFMPAPGISTEMMHLFLAQDLKPKHMDLDHDEFIQRQVVSEKKLKKMILNGAIIDAKTIVGYFYYLMKQKRQG